MEHCRTHSLEELRADPSYLDGLFLHEQEQEARLEAETLEFYRAFRHDVTSTAAVGGFEKTWTVARA